MGGFGGGNIAISDKDSSTAIPFQLRNGGETLVALQDTKTAQTLYVLLRSLEQKGHLDVTFTSFGQA
eukprot:1284191-Lingulodinium_polyedra.AAC.1